MSFKTVSALLRSKWFIDQQWAQEHMPIVASLLKGQNTGTLLFEKKAYKDDGPDSNEERKPFQAIQFNAGVVTSGYYSSFNNAPEGSIALITIAGPILKYGDMCSYGSVDYMEMIKSADKTPNISGIIIKLDSPGGQCDGTANLADSIKNCKTPVVAFVDDGMMASAAMWVGSAATKIYASQKTDWIGSIGVFCTLYDFKTYLEKEGLPVHEIYAPQSTEKNKDYKDAIAGNYALIEGELKFLADTFINTIKTNRGETATANEEKWSKGKMFYAEEAVKIGLIDGIKTFEEVVAELSNTKSNTNENSNNANTMFNKYPSLHSLKGKEASDITAEEMNAANAELKTNGVTGVAVISIADAEAADKALTDIKATNDKIAELETKAAASAKLAEDLATANSTIQTLNSTIATYGKKPGAEHANPDKPNESVEVKTTDEKKFEDYAHNKEANSKLKEMGV